MECFNKGVPFHLFFILTIRDHIIIIIFKIGLIYCQKCKVKTPATSERLALLSEI
jgi:hypothetical protein